MDLLGMPSSTYSSYSRPALYIPSPVGNGEQTHNLQDVLAAGGAVTISDGEFTPEYVRSALIPLLSDSKRLSEMAALAKQAGVLDGTERFVALIDEVLSRR